MPDNMIHCFRRRRSLMVRDVDDAMAGWPGVVPVGRIPPGQGTSVGCIAGVGAGALGWPSPPRREAFHGLAGDIVRAVAPRSEADPVAILAQLLACFGNAAGRNRYYRVEDDRHYPNLFVVLVGPSSTARKGVAWTRVKTFMSEADPEWQSRCVGSGLGSGEGLIARVGEPVRYGRKKGRDLLGPISTALDGRFLVVEPEFSRLLKVANREGSILTDVLRDVWDRGEFEQIVKRDPHRARDAHVSLICHTNAADVVRHLRTTDQVNGFANRFLWFMVRRSQKLAEGGWLSDEVLQMFGRELAESLEFARIPGQVQWDADGRRLWYEVYDWLSEDRPGMAGAMLARAEAQVVRLALVYALLDRSDCIGERHLRAALALWDYCARSVAFLFGDSTGDPVADRVLSLLRDAGPAGLDRTRLRDAFQRHMYRERLDRALNLLRVLGLARMVVDPTGGRPRERWLACVPDSGEVGGPAGEELPDLDLISDEEVAEILHGCCAGQG